MRIVPCSECNSGVEPDAPYYATPCGTFCEDCMDEHAQQCEGCAEEFDIEKHQEN